MAGTRVVLSKDKPEEEEGGVGRTFPVMVIFSNTFLKHFI